MIDATTARLIGTALIVSEDAVTTRQLAEAMQELALSVEACIKVSDALDRVNHSKLEVVVIDFSLGNQATRPSTSARLGLQSNCGHVRNHRQQRGDHLCPESGFKLCPRKTPDLRFDPTHP